MPALIKKYIVYINPFVITSLILRIWWKSFALPMLTLGMVSGILVSVYIWVLDEIKYNKLKERELEVKNINNVDKK